MSAPDASRDPAGDRLARLLQAIIQPGTDHAADGPLWLFRQADRVLLSAAAFAALPPGLAAGAETGVDVGDPAAAAALPWRTVFALGMQLAREERCRAFLPARQPCAA